MSTSQAAAELGITKNAVIGLANRRGIKFEGKWTYPTAHKPREPKPRPALIASAPTPHVVTPKSDWKPKPSLRCPWLGCIRTTEPGQMLCPEHQKKPLFGSVAVCS